MQRNLKMKYISDFALNFFLHIAKSKKLNYFWHPKLWKDLRLLATTEKNAKLTAVFDKIVCLLFSAQIFPEYLKMDFTIKCCIFCFKNCI
jgi:hypothetical protein